MMYSFRGLIAHTYMQLMCILPLQNKVVYSSFDGKLFGDNPKEIFMGLTELDNNIKHIWLLNDKDYVIPGAKVVKANSIRAIYHLATAKLWVDNSRKREWIIKRKEQYYVQTWHGDICLKKVEKDAEKTLPRSYISEAKHDSKMADLFISGSKWRTLNYKNAFWYTGEILELGSPKADVFYHDFSLARNKVEQSFNLKTECRIALYVPTFRKNNNLECYKFDEKLIQRTLMKKWPGDWVILIRLHPNLNNYQNLIEYNNVILNATNYNSTNELIVASDLIITDYSGCMFNGLEANKKVILFAKDVDEYLQSDRELYFNFHELPFPLATNEQELCDIITNYSESKYRNLADDFKDFIGFYNSANSTNLVSQYIYDQVWGQ